jgi:phosphoribosylamine--glycine ligase
VLTPALEAQALTEIIAPTVKAMADEARPIRACSMPG